MEKLLLKACQNGQKGVVTTFLKKDGINVNAVDEQGMAPIHYACSKGYRDIVKLLLEKEADVSMVSNRSVTPLHMAVSSGNKEIIKMLVDAGADVNATDKEGKSVLIYGVEARKVEAVKCLVSLGADTTLMDNTNRTALDYANALGLTQLIEGLSTGGGQNTDSFGNTALHQSCSNGQSEAVKAMLAGKDVDINALNDQGRTPVFFSVMQDNLLITELQIGRAHV